MECPSGRCPWKGSGLTSNIEGTQILDSGLNHEPVPVIP